MTSPVRVTKQKVAITISGDTRKVSGRTEITFQQTSDVPLRVIFLNARQMKIESVFFGDKPADFQVIDTHSALEMKNGPLIRDSEHFSRVCQDVLNSPELIIQLDSNFKDTITVNFTVDDKSSGICRENGILYTNNVLDGPSSWFPCIDSIGQRSWFTLELTYPQNLICVGPGKDLFVSYNEETGNNTVRYTFPFAVHPRDIGFSVGEFKTSQIQLPNISLQYYYTKDEELLKHTLSPLQEIVQEVNDLFIPEETVMNTLSVVYIPELHEILHCPGMFFYPSNLIIPDGNAALWVYLVPKLYEAVVAQYVYYLFPISKPRAEWLQEGLIRYFADYLCSKRYGKSFTDERRWNDINLIIMEDIHPSVVLSAIDPATGYPFRDHYMRIKAKQLINMIATTMNEPLYFLMRPMFKIAQEQLIGLEDKFFSKMVKFCSMINFKSFKNQWLNSNGMPIFTFNFTADRRNKQMKLVLYQSPSCKTTNIKFFTGNLLVQLRDLEQPHEFMFQVENVLIQQQMKYFARMPKSKKTIYTFVNETTENVDLYRGKGIMWVSLDPTHSWLMRVVPRLPEFMLHYMLKLLRDVYTQHETLSALDEWKYSKETTEILQKFLENNSCFYGVRGHAARILATFANDDNPDSTHKAVLKDWYKNNFFFKDKPKNHNFQDLPNHFVQLEVIRSLSIIRNNENYTPQDVVDFLCQILEESSNNGNQYSDDDFQEEAILALGRINPMGRLQEIESRLVERVRGSQTSGGFCNSLISSRYVALTANLLKQRDEIDHWDSTQSHCQTIQEMRAILLDDSPYIDFKCTIFKCLLFFSLIDLPVTFAENVSMIKQVSTQGKLMLAAGFLREIYRFILNTPLHEGKGRVETFLLRLPRGMKREEIVKKLVCGDDAADVAETLWSIMTIDAKHHSILRSEALRAYTTLYGKGTPEPFLKREVSPGIEISATTLSSRIHLEQRIKRTQRSPK